VQEKIEEERQNQNGAIYHEEGTMDGPGIGGEKK